MEKPCEICGNIGWVDFILICSKCKVTREHRYCMTVMHGDDEEKWVCDECGSNHIPSSKLAQSKQRSGTGMKFTLKKPPKNAKVRYLPPEELIGLESGGMRNYSSSSSTSFLAHRSPSKKSFVSKMEVIPSSTPPSKFSIKPNPSVVSPGCREPPKSSSMPSCLKDKKFSASAEKKDSVFQKEHYRQQSPVAKRSFPRNTQTSHAMMLKETDGSARQCCGESPTVKRVTFGKLPVPGVSSDGRAQQFGVESSAAKCLRFGKLCKNDIDSGHTSQLVQSFHTVSSGNDFCTEAQPKNINSKGRESPEVTMVFDSYLPNHPAASPTWKGTFKITSDTLPCSFFVQAHPPCKVHSKVYNLSKNLSKTLPFEMLPQHNFWVETFDGDIPGELDIGLYFLPSTTSPSDEQSYCSLLEYLDVHDLLVRSCVGEVELFVFSSKHLKEDSREINEKHFLWGLFRSSEASIVASHAIVLAQDSKMRDKQEKASKEMALTRVATIHSSDSERIPSDQVQQPHSEEHDEGVDMNIDMLGGLEVGFVDVVVPKLTDPACGDHSAPEPIDTACGDHKEEKLVGDEIKPLPSIAARGTVFEFSPPIKVKEESNDDIETPLSFASSYLPEVQEFERELQRSFDRFAALMQLKEAGKNSGKVKVEEAADAQKQVV